MLLLRACPILVAECADVGAEAEAEFKACCVSEAVRGRMSCVVECIDCRSSRALRSGKTQVAVDVRALIAVRSSFLGSQRVVVKILAGITRWQARRTSLTSWGCVDRGAKRPSLRCSSSRIMRLQPLLHLLPPKGSNIQS